MTSLTYSSTRPDVNPCGTPLETLNAGGLQVVSNLIKGNGTYSASGFLASVFDFADDHACEIGYATVGANDNVGAFVRGQNAGGFTAYVANTSLGDGRVYLQKFVAGVPSTLTAPVVALGSTLSISVATSGGNAAITVFVDGVPIDVPYVDSSSPITGGQPGGYYDFGDANASSILYITGSDASSSAGTIGSIVQRRRPVGRGPLMRRFPGVFKRQVGSVRQRQVLLQLYSAPGIPLANTAVNFWTAPNEAAAAVDGVNPTIQRTTDSNGLVLLSGLIIAAGVGQVRCAIPGDVTKSRNVTVTFI